jgi:hypothetical protein
MSWSSFPREPGIAGGKSDYKVVFSGPLEVGQDALMSVDVKRQPVNVSRLDAYLNGFEELHTGRDIIVAAYRNGIWLAEVTIPEGLAKGTWEFVTEEPFEEEDVFSGRILQTGLGVRGSTLSLYGRIA